WWWPTCPWPGWAVVGPRGSTRRRAHDAGQRSRASRRLTPKRTIPMRRHLLLFGTSLFVLHTHAQCDHDPVISPSSLILCPDESAVLTTGVYGASQLLRDGDPIPGATEQQLVLPATEAVGYMFTVQDRKSTRLNSSHV